MSRANVNTETKFIDSDGFMLTDLDTDESLMMIPCDTAGNFSWTGVTRAPLTRNAMQTSTTSNQYSDLELPWLSIPQEDWTGGRGNEIFTKDTTRYYDGKRAQTSFNEVIYNGPLDYYSIGYRDALTNYPSSLSWVNLLSSTANLAVAFTPETNLTIGELYVHLRRRGNPLSTVNVSLRTGLTADDTILASKQYSKQDITDTVAEFRKFTFTDISLTANTTYYIVVNSSGDKDNYWQVGVNKDGNNNCYKSANGGIWSSSDSEIYFRIAEGQSTYRTKLFMYEQMMYAVRQQPNGTPTLWMNGDISLITSATSVTATDTSKSWTENQWAGARVGLVYRNGIEGQVTVWKTITSNTATTITIAEEWDVTPESGSIFIIVDTPLWTEIDNHGLTSYVTDIHVIRGVVYFCQGDYVNARKMRWENGSFEFMDLGFQACYLQSVRDSSGIVMWRGRNDDDNHKRSVDMGFLLDWESASTQLANVTSAVTTSGGAVVTGSVDFTTGDFDQKHYVIDINTFSSEKNTGSVIIMLQESEDDEAWHDVQSITAKSKGLYYLTAHCNYRYRRLKITASGTDCSVNNITVTTSQTPHFEHKITLLDNYGKITSIVEYGAEQYKSPWIFQEGMVSSINKVDGTIDTYTLDRINIDELQTTAEEWNASTSESSDVYLTFAWLNGFQRYYNTQLEGKGPDKDAGLPFERQGRITKVISYPSNIFVSVDGEDGYSSVLQFNQSGWCEIYRAPNAGERINDMYFQPIYGTRPDRLWMSVGDDIVWLAMPSKILYALQDQYAEYTHESVIVSAWHTAGMMDVEKLWQSLKIMADNLDENTCWVEADYQIDEEDIWHPIENFYVTSPSHKEDLNPDGSVNGKKLRYRLRLQTTDMHKTPKINAVVLEAVGRVDIKWSYTFYFRNIKWKRDLVGEFEDIEPLDVQNKLDEWANGLKKLRLNSRWKIFDDKIVYLDAVQTSILTELQEGYIAQITLNEL